MKKIISIIAIISLLIMGTIHVFAIDATDNLSIEETVVFDENNYAHLSKSDIYEQKLNALDIPENYHRLIYKTMYDEICNASIISTVSSYYIETDNGNDLIQTSKDDYMEAVKIEKEKIAKRESEIKMQIKNTLPKLVTDNISLNSVIPSEGNTGTLNNGTLNIFILLVTNDGLNYTCTGLFQWETMPSARYMDAFGLSRDTTTTVISKSAQGLYEMEYTIRYMSGSTYVSNQYLDSIELEFNDLKANSSGYAFEIPLPIDAAENTYPYTTVNYSSVSGLLLYKGYVTNSATNGVNHWATYGHKRYSLGVNGIDFSVPFSGGFTINWYARYEQLTEEHTWTR